ncbi:hypothetical protein [Limnobacter sp.]|uniref:hypothetical protein n=1 Tax=Limnobacter sp. TaxID=2003368 RepID=UPI003510DAEB
MTPFSAFALFVSAALTHQHLTQTDAQQSEAPAVPLAVETPSASALPAPVKRGGNFAAKDVLQFKGGNICQDASAADPNLCANFPRLTGVPMDEAQWLELGQKAVLSFTLGFGQTEFSSQSGKAPVNLNTTQFFPEVLRAGLTPKGYGNVQKEFNTKDATQTISYDLRICSLGGRLRASVVDSNPINQVGVADSFTISESACEEMNFRTDPSVLSSVFTAIQKAEDRQFELSSQGQVARMIGKMRYAGSVANLKQNLNLKGNTAVIDYLDGALGYCIGTGVSTTMAWDQQCLKTGVVMDGLRVKKVLQGDGVARFPGTSFIALSLANGVDENNKPRQSMYEIVGKDLAFAPNAFTPSEGVMTVVGHQGDKIRIQFKGENIRMTRLNSLGETLGEKTISSVQVQTKAGFVH